MKVETPSPINTNNRASNYRTKSGSQEIKEVELASICDHFMSGKEMMRCYIRERTSSSRTEGLDHTTTINKHGGVSSTAGNTATEDEEDRNNDKKPPSGDWLGELVDKRPGRK